MKSRPVRSICITGFLLPLASAIAFAQTAPAGPGAVAKVSAITYDPHRISNIYK